MSRSVSRLTASSRRLLRSRHALWVSRPCRQRRAGLSDMYRKGRSRETQWRAPGIGQGLRELSDFVHAVEHLPRISLTCRACARGNMGFKNSKRGILCSSPALMSMTHLVKPRAVRLYHWPLNG